MAKGLSKELDQEIKRILGEVISLPPNSHHLNRPNVNSLESNAIEYLIDLGVLEARSDGFASEGVPEMYYEYVRVTAYGREYYKRLTTPAPWYWFKQNWFPAIVAAATIAASVGGIIVNTLD